MIEGVVYGGVDREEALSWSGGFEALLLAFSSSDRKVRVLSPVVGVQPPIVLGTPPDRSERGRIGWELVDHWTQDAGRGGAPHDVGRSRAAGQGSDAHA